MSVWIDSLHVYPVGECFRVDIIHDNLSLLRLCTDTHDQIFSYTAVVHAMHDTHNISCQKYFDI